MAPAAQQPDAQIYTSSHTARVNQTAALDHTTQSRSLSKRRHTHTVMKVVTVTLGEPIPTPSLSALYNVQHPNNSGSLKRPTDNALIPKIHGIVPPAPRSHHPPSTPALLPTITTIASATPQYRPSNILQPTTFRTSSYPRPSLPGFLYPETVRIIPLHIAMPTEQYSMNGGAGSVIWCLPYGLEIPIFGFMLFGFVWVVLVWLVNFPPRTWCCNDIASSTANKKKAGRKKRETLFGWGGKERRPVDKPSKHAPLTINAVELVKQTIQDLGRNNANSTAIPTIHIDYNAHLPTNEVTYRRQAINRRTSSTPNTAVRFSLSTPSPTTSTFSPPNPFLQPPDFLSPHTTATLKPRNSSEWLADREKYFSLSSPSHARTPSVGSSSSASDSYEYEMDTAAMEALEAGVATPKPRSPRSSAVHKRQGSWVNLGLEKVEGAVNGFADRLARWTDELDRGEREEGLLLPVSELKGIKVE